MLANQEGNRRIDVERLRAAGVPVWVTVIRTVDEAMASLRTMFRVALAWPEPPWLARAEQVWQEAVLAPQVRAAIPIWRAPWIERYPHVSLDDLAARRPSLIVLPDEPYPFSANDGPEIFPRHQVALVEGRSLTWYGPSLVTARSTLLSQLEAARPALSC